MGSRADSGDLDTAFFRGLPAASLLDRRPDREGAKPVSVADTRPASDGDKEARAIKASSLAT